MTAPFTNSSQNQQSSHWDYIYSSLLQHLIQTGEETLSRSGMTKSIYNITITYHSFPSYTEEGHLTTTLPILTLRPIPMGGIIEELIFDLLPRYNIKHMGTTASKWWKPYADEQGELGASAYSRYLRRWPFAAPNQEIPNEILLTPESANHAGSSNFCTGGGIDQVAHAIQQLQEEPFSRQVVLSLHNPATEINHNQCPPCPTTIHLTPTLCTLNMSVFWRSQDIALGLPLDIIRFSLLHTYICAALQKMPGALTFHISNLHHYLVQKYSMEELSKRPSTQQFHELITYNTYPSVSQRTWEHTYKRMGLPLLIPYPH